MVRVTRPSAALQTKTRPSWPARSERGPVLVDRHREQPAFMDSAVRPEGRARLAVERVDAARGITDHQRFAAQGPATGDA